MSAGGGPRAEGGRASGRRAPATASAQDGRYGVPTAYVHPGRVAARKQPGVARPAPPPAPARGGGGARQWVFSPSLLRGGGRGEGLRHRLLPGQPFLFRQAADPFHEATDLAVGDLQLLGDLEVIIPLHPHFQNEAV